MPVFSFDTEAHRIPKTPKFRGKATYTIGGVIPRFVCLTACTQQDDGSRGETELIARADEASALNTYLRMLTDPEMLLVAHNAAFDIWVLAGLAQERGCFREYMEATFRALDEGRLICTMVREKLLLNCRGFLSYHSVERRQPSASLAACVARYTGRIVEGKTGDDVWRLRYGELDQVPSSEWPPAAVAYAKFDAEYALDVFDAQTTEAQLQDYLTPGNAIPTESSELRAAVALLFTTMGGLRAIPSEVAALSARVRANIETAYETLVPGGIVTRKVAKGSRKVTYKKNKKEIQRLIEEALGDEAPRTPPSSKFPDGQIQDSEEALRASKHPLLLTLANISADSKLSSTYVNPLALACVTTVHPEYDTFKETSRSSSTAPNVQNQSRTGGVRECWVASLDGDEVLISADYSGQELVAFAQNALDIGLPSRMAVAINEDRDLHTEMACQIANLDLADQLDEPLTYTTFEAIRKGKSKHQLIPKAAATMYRTLAKAANFGFPGGMGVDSFCEFALATYGVEITPSRGAELRATHRKTWPEMAGYFKHINTLTSHGDYVVTHAPGGMVRRTAFFPAACNSLFQGRSAQMSKQALYEVMRACLTPGSPLYGCRIVAFIHDEIIVAAKLAQASGAAKEITRIMEAAGRDICPDVLSKAPAAMAFRWYKAMEPVLDADGEIVPWVPNAQSTEGDWLLITDGELPPGAYWSDPYEVTAGWTAATPH